MIPIFDNTAPITTGQVTVIGFMQLFINDVDVQGNITATILNVAGCGNNPSTGPPVSGGGFSPIPVRLIHQ